VPELLLSFAESPIISEATIVDPGVHMSIVGTLSAEYVLQHLSPAGQMQAQKDWRWGGGDRLAGFGYLHQLGEAVAEEAATQPAALKQLANTTPYGSEKLGMLAAIDTMASMLCAERADLVEMAHDLGADVAREVIETGAAEYQEADREAAIAQSRKLLDDDRLRAEAQDFSAVYIAKTKVSLTPATAAPEALAFWSYMSEGNEAAADAAEYSPFANYDESLGDVFDERRFQAARRIAPWLVQNAGESQYDFPENSAVSFFRRGALRGLTFVAVATKEFAVRAAAGGA
jgi:hypothetical protein